MITGHMMMAMSLDGFVARSDHTLDWLMKHDTSGEDHGFVEFMEKIDIIVMGRGSFQTVLGFDQWPYDKHVVVMSRTLRDADLPEKLKGKASISALDPVTQMQALQRQGCRHVYVDGAALVQSFLREGLIADMKLTMVPILIGSGIRLFGDLAQDIDMTLSGVQQFNSGLVDLRYKVA